MYKEYFKGLQADLAEIEKMRKELEQLAFKDTNLSKRYKKFQEINSIIKIQKELIKWETTTRGF